MHINKVTLFPEKYPDKNYYPFCLDIFNRTGKIELSKPVTFLLGENGTGKSTFLEAIARKCNIHIWEGLGRSRIDKNRYEKDLYKYIDVQWVDKSVPGSFFASEIFRNFAQNLDEWASVTPDTLDYFGGRSLMSQSHGQCHMSYFENRFKIEGIYFLDEPENALSPKKQVDLLNLLGEISGRGHAQFIIATHSPILLALPDSDILSFDHTTIDRIEYEQTEHYKIYKDFLNNRGKYI